MNHTAELIDKDTVALDCNFKGQYETIYMDISDYEKIKNHKLFKLKKSEDTAYIQFQDKDGNKVSIHRYFINANASNQYVYFINGNWRDLRKCNLKVGRAGSNRDEKFMNDLKKLEKKQKSLAEISKNKNEVAYTFAKKTQPHYTINKETNGLTLETGNQKISFKGMSDSESMQYIMNLINSQN